VRLTVVAIAVTVLVSPALYILVRPSQGFGPALFAFLKPSETMLDQARQRLGEPWLEYDTYVFRGEIDPLIHMDEAEHYAWQLRQAEKTGRQLVKVYVLEYRGPDAMSEYAKLVFHEDRLLYALVPVSLAEATFQQIRMRVRRERPNGGDPGAGIRLPLHCASHLLRRGRGRLPTNFWPRRGCEDHLPAANASGLTAVG